ncbi:hypothetical protein PVAND_014341 [Polypedilum vanderplanki]|uniref:Uncharacterized protein n=1 Tax=Polypedilum vanderplanki TaxID=319348 RepID=A0A9J6CST4_POLVA|nr:hypothetical protein PVAND_014341 [Polypedilum vanderplanki]
MQVARTSFKNTDGLLRHLNSQHKFPKDTENNTLNNQTQIIDTPSEISVDNLAKFHDASKDYTNDPNEEIFLEDTTYSKQIKISYNDLRPSQYFNLLESILVDVELDQSIFRCKLISHKNTTYKIGYFIFKHLDNQTECLKIVDQLIWNTNCFIITEEYYIKSYKKHMRCYELGDSKGIFKLISVEDLTGIPFLMHKVNSKHFYFRTNHV